MISNEELDQWEALANAATPGPWFAHVFQDETDDWPTVYTMSRGKDGDDLVAETYYWQANAFTGHHNLTTVPVATAQANAEFIAITRMALPVLTHEVKQSRALFAPYTLDQVRAIFAVFEDYFADLAWTLERTSGITFWVPCNDVFAPAADGERIAPDDQEIAALEQARNDAQEHALWPLLWIARKRHQPPMTVWLQRWREAAWAQEMVPLLEKAGESHDKVPV